MRIELRSLIAVSLCVLLASCGGGNKKNPPPPPPQPQTIAFATQGTVTAPAGTTVTNVASGGAGTGSLSYQSSNPAVASINATTGVAALLTVGATTITATKAASTGFASATASYTLNVTQGSQAIAFAQNGPFDVLLDSTTNNAASGGSGAGAITYASSDTAAVAVNPTTGVAIATGIGAATITATKAADTNYAQGQASYTINVQTADKVSAWIGANDTLVSLPQSANGKQFGRALVADCAVGETVVDCTAAAVGLATSAIVTDTKATLTTPAYYSIVNGQTVGAPIVVSSQRFAERILHGAVRFNGKYWVIGGGVPDLPRDPLATETAHIPQSDVWSSVDGKSWRLETANAAFGARWVHRALVFNNELWLLAGFSTTPGSVWRSSDGVNWQSVANNANFGSVHTRVAASVFGGSMWFILNGSVYSSSDGASWQQRATNVGGPLGRGYATLTVYNNELWYLGGATGFTPTPSTGDATSDVWKSSDGVAWTQVNATSPFTPRFQHNSFVLGGQLWVFGGRPIVNGVIGQPLATAYSTTDGVTWTPRALSTEADRVFLSTAVQESDRVTLIGGFLRSYSNHVLQSTTGESWSVQLPLTSAPNLFSEAVSFNGFIWLIGGGRMDQSGTNEVWRSADGINWSRVMTSGSVFSPRDRHRAVVFNGRLWVIGGTDFLAAEGNPETFNNEVWSSVDGVSWTQHPDPGFAARSMHDAIVFNGRLWVIAGSNGTSRFNDVWSTADGQTWTREIEHAAFSERSAHQVVAHNNQLYLLGGVTGPLVGSVPATDEVWRSTDGRTWTQLGGSHFTARMDHAAGVKDGRIFVVGGGSGNDLNTSTIFNDVWSSADGITWRLELAEAASPFPDRRFPSLLVHGSDLFLIGGYGIGRQHDIWRSSNGVDWRAAHSQAITSP